MLGSLHSWTFTNQQVFNEAISCVLSANPVRNLVRLYVLVGWLKCVTTIRAFAGCLDPRQ